MNFYKYQYEQQQEETTNGYDTDYCDCTISFDMETETVDFLNPIDVDFTDLPVLSECCPNCNKTYINGKFKPPHL
jgi:uncharacterized protein (UPF0212 family)